MNGRAIAAADRKAPSLTNTHTQTQSSMNTHRYDSTNVTAYERTIAADASSRILFHVVFHVLIAVNNQPIVLSFIGHTFNLLDIRFAADPMPGRQCGTEDVARQRR